jgi:hypothetical protein
VHLPENFSQAVAKAVLDATREWAAIKKKQERDQRQSNRLMERMPLLQRARLAEQYDMAIMLSKGMGTTAARTLARRGQIMVHKIKECEDASARASAVGGRRRVTGNWPTRSQHRQTSSKRGLVFDWTLFVLLRPFF